MSNWLDWFTDNVTYCSKDCDNKNCILNKKNENHKALHMYANYEDTELCPFHKQKTNFDLIKELDLEGMVKFFAENFLEDGTPWERWIGDICSKSHREASYIPEASACNLCGRSSYCLTPEEIIREWLNQKVEEGE